MVQELLRHSNSSITLDLHQQAEADAKCSAQYHVADLFRLSKASYTTVKTEKFSGNGGLFCADLGARRAKFFSALVWLDFGSVRQLGSACILNIYEMVGTAGFEPTTSTV